MNAIIFDKNVDVNDLIIVYKMTQTLFMPILMNYIPLTGHKLLFSDTDISNEDNETILLAVKKYIVNTKRFNQILNFSLFITQLN